MIFFPLVLACSQDLKSDLSSADSGLFEGAEWAYAPIVQNGQLLSQDLGHTCDVFDLIDDYRFLCIQSGRLSIVDESQATERELTTAVHVAGEWHQDHTWISIDGILHHYDTELKVVDIDIPVPIERMEAHGDTLWLWGIDRLFRIRQGILSEIALSDELRITDFTVGDTRLWLRTPWLVELDLLQEPLQVRSQSDAPIDDLQVDSESTLWWIADGRLYRQINDRPIEISLPSTPQALHGPQIWIQAETESYHFDAGTFTAYAIPASDTLQQDAHGRLIQTEAQQLMRHSSNRPVVVVGLPESVTTQHSVQLLPTDPDSIDTLRVWLDSTELPLEPNPWRLTLDPEQVESGEHLLRFWMASELGDAIDTQPLWFGELPDVNWSDVQAISETHCLSCHGGSTLTTLMDKEDWMTQIDSIIHEVSTEGMPLGGPYLSDADITTIRAWKAGGFQ